MNLFFENERFKIGEIAGVFGAVYCFTLFAQLILTFSPPSQAPELAVFVVLLCAPVPQSVWGPKRQLMLGLAGAATATAGGLMYFSAPTMPLAGVASFLWGGYAFYLAGSLD